MVVGLIAQTRRRTPCGMLVGAGLERVWHHDGAAKAPTPIGFGNYPVVAGVVVVLPWLSRSVCLPVLARLWSPGGTGKLAHARTMVERQARYQPTPQETRAVLAAWAAAEI